MNKYGKFQDFNVLIYSSTLHWHHKWLLQLSWLELLHRNRRPLRADSFATAPQVRSNKCTGFELEIRERIRRPRQDDGYQYNNINPRLTL
jgi:hypothetical protein